MNKLSEIVSSPLFLNISFAIFVAIFGVKLFF